MPAQHNLNVPPYNDDWDPKNNFHRVMFRPGFPIQARELNQAQGILQDQVEQFASAMMRDGDVVTPGEFYLTNPAPYIRVSSITNGSRPEEYIGYNFKGVQSGVKARVVHAVEATETDDVTFYVTYESSGVSTEFETFLEQETLESDTPQNYTAKVGVTSISKPVSSPAIGNGTLFTVTEGAYYVNGFIVRNEEQIITLDKYATDPDFQVGFIISEEFVTSAEDSSLLDNSQGYSNFAAPGADRLKITLTLGKLLPDSKVPDFILLARVQNGGIVGSTNRGIKWDWLYDILAKRTFDESGDYIVSDFAVQPLEYANLVDVDGVFDPDPDTGEYPPVPNSGISDPLTFDAADALYSVRIDPGLAYVQGYECGFSSPLYVYGNKPRSLNFIDSNFTQITKGYNINITNVFGAPSVQNISEGSLVVAFDTLTLYRNFGDGHVGDSLDIFPNGTTLGRPKTYGDVPPTTVHLITDGRVGDLKDTLDPSEIIYNPTESNSCVISVSNPEIYMRGSSINGAIINIANVVRPRPSGVMRPRHFTPDNNARTPDDPYVAYNATYNLGFLNSVYFTELAVDFDDPNTFEPDEEWRVGFEVAGRESQAVGVVERGSDNNILIVSNVIGEFIPGEYIEQQIGEKQKKIGRVMREGEVVSFQFFTPQVIDGGVTEMTVRSLGLETTLTVGAKNIRCSEGCPPDTECIDGLCVPNYGGEDCYYDGETRNIHLNPAGRRKLYNFPYTGGSAINERVNYEVETSSGAVGYAVTVPAKVTNTLNKTKSIYSELSSLSADKFSADISFNDADDAEVFQLANGALFSGRAGDNFITCENFQGDASEELVANDIITLIDDQGNAVSKLVLMSTKPIGYGRNRTKCLVYFTTTLERTVTSKAVQRMRVRTFGEETENLIFNLPIKTVATLETDPKTTRIDYRVHSQFIRQLEPGRRITLTTSKDNERFNGDPNSYSVTIVRGITNITPDSNGRFLGVEKVALSDGGRQVVLELNGDAPDAVILKVTCEINVINAQAKQKILKNKRLEIEPKIQSQPDLVSTNKLPSNRVLSLETADVFKIKSITMTKPAGDPEAIDISENYVFDNGQRDNIYDLARLILLPGRPAALDTVFIELQYFEHSDLGDFFSVDSYTHDNGVSYGEIPSYIQGSTSSGLPKTQGNVIALRDCVDFRPVVNTVDSTIASITDNVTAGFAANFKGETFDGDAFVPRIPVASTNFRCDISYYLPRFDTLFLDKSGSMILKEGVPSVNPKPPEDLSTAIRLYDLFLPAYTFSVNDIEVKKFNYRRYTMADIASIDRRVENITEVVSLTLLELSAINTGVRDAVTGLDRFKNGIVVDAFNDHSKGDVDALDYVNSIDPVRTHLRAGVFADQVELQEKNQTDNQRLADKYANNDGVITCPYDNVDFLSNPYATRAIKLHPFASHSYHGSLKLYPEVDTFLDVTSRPNLVIENNRLYDAMKAMPDNRVASGFSTVWGEWETNGRSETSKHTKESEQSNSSLMKISGVSQSSMKLLDQPNSKFNADTSSIKNTSFGDRKVDIQLAHRMRSRPVLFSASRLKPNTRYYAFFDDVNVTSWVSTDQISNDFPDSRSRYVTPSNVNRTPFGEPLVSDDEGNLSGVFIVPNGRPPLAGTTFTDMGSLQYELSGSTRSFNTGQRVLRFTNSVSNTLDKESVGAYTESTYTSGSVLNDKTESVVSTRLADISHRTDDNDRTSRTITSSGVADIEVSIRGPERLSRTVEVSKQYVTDVTGVNETEVVNQVQVMSEGQNNTEVRYDVSVEREVVTEQAPSNVKYIEVEQRPENRMLDPMAQSFLVDNTNPEGIFVTELEVAFEKRDRDQSIMAYIVTTDGGTPTKTIVPHSKVVKAPYSTLRVKCNIPDDRASAVLKGGYVINGRNSGASATVKSDVVFETPSANPDKNFTNHVYNVVLENYEGEFLPDEVITCPNMIGEKSLPVMQIVRDEVELTSIDLFDIGEGYDENTVVEVSAPELPGGRTASAVVKIAPIDPDVPGHNGQVYDVVITDPGTGYVNVPLVYIVGSGNNAQSLCRTRPARKAVSMGVSTSINGSIYTKFKFEAPVYLMGNTEYAFVLESPNSVDYKVYTSVLGETILEENSRVTKQASTGSLFKSQNGGVWTEDQTQDVTFKLKRASFQVNTSSKITLNNEPLRSMRLRNDPIETNAESVDLDSTIMGMNPRVVMVFHNNHGLAPDDLVALDGVKGDGNGETFAGIPVTELNTLHKVLDTDLNTYTIMVKTPCVTSSVGGGGTVIGTYNRPYEAINVCTGMMSFGTSLIGTTNRATQAVGLSVIDVDSFSGKEKRFNDDYRYILDQPVPINLMETYYYDKPMQVTNLLNECQYSDGVHMQDQKSVETTIRMSTVSTRVSPVLDLQRTNYTTIRNLIDKPKPESNILGSTASVITFNNEPTLVTGEQFGMDDFTVRVQTIDPTGRTVLVKTPPHKRFYNNVKFDQQALTDIGVTSVTTRQSENFSNESKILGSANAKWISKLFTFENPCDGLTVKLTSIFYEIDSLKVYFRPRTIGFDADISTSPWIAFNPGQSLPGEERRVDGNNNVILPDVVIDPTLPLLKTPGLPDNIDKIKPRSSESVNPDEIKSDEWQSVTWTAQDLAKFDAVAIKIVMTSDNPAYAPLIDDLQLIASE